MLGFVSGRECRPRRHYAPAALEQVAAAIRPLYLATYGVRQCHFGDLAREIRTLGSPIAKR
jgi:hypothetical protein